MLQIKRVQRCPETQSCLSILLSVCTFVCVFQLKKLVTAPMSGSLDTSRSTDPFFPNFDFALLTLALLRNPDLLVLLGDLGLDPMDCDVEVCFFRLGRTATKIVTTSSKPMEVTMIAIVSPLIAPLSSPLPLSLTVDVVTGEGVGLVS